MKILLFALLILPFGVLAQDADPLAVTLPNGKVVHFQTAEQKAKYEAAQKARVASPNMSAEWAKFNANQKAKQDHAQEVASVRAALDQLAIRADVRIILFKKDGVDADICPYVERDRSLVHSVDPGNTYWAPGDGTSIGTHFVQGDFRALHAIDGDTCCCLLYSLGIEDSGSSRVLKFTINPADVLTAKKIPFSSQSVIDEALAQKPEIKPRL